MSNKFEASENSEEENYEMRDVWNSDKTIHVKCAYYPEKQEYQLKDPERGLYLYYGDSKFITKKNFTATMQTMIADGTVTSSNEVFGDTDDEKKKDCDTGIKMLRDLQYYYDYYTSYMNSYKSDGFICLYDILYPQGGGGFATQVSYPDIVESYDVLGMQKIAGFDKVLAHEYSHRYVGAYATLDGTGYERPLGFNEQYNLNEAVADILGIVMYTKMTGSDDPDWVMDSFLGSRDIKNVGNFFGYGTADYYKKPGWALNDSDHDYGTIISHAAYLMTTKARDDCSDDGKLSMDELGQLWANAIQKFSSDTDFQQCASIVQHTAAQLNFSSEKQYNIAAAFEQMGLSGDSLSSDFYKSSSVNVPGDAISYNGNSYKLYDEGMTWEDAAKKCADMGGHLVYIGSDQEQSAVRELLKGGSKNAYWTGLMRKGSSFVRKKDEEKEEDEKNRDTWIWEDGSSPDSFFWSSGEPNNSSDNGNFENRCCILGSDAGTGSAGDWIDISSVGNSSDFYKSENIGFICEWEGTGQTSDSAATAIQGTDPNHSEAAQVENGGDEAQGTDNGQQNRQEAAEEFCREYFTQWTYADGAVNYFAENSRDAAQTYLAEGSQALNDFQSQNMDSPLYLNASCFLEDVQSTTEDEYTYKVSITYVAVQNDPAYFTWEELQKGRFTSVFYIMVDDNNQITDVYYGDDGGTFPADSDTSQSGASFASDTLQQGTWQYSNDDKVSTFSLNQIEGGELYGVLSFWHDYGSSSSDEDFDFLWRDGVWEYELPGSRSGEMFRLTFQDNGDGTLNIRVVPVDGTYYSWETGDESDVWSDGVYTIVRASYNAVMAENSAAG